MTPEAVISPSATAMLNEAIGKGALFSVATARTPATVGTILENVDMNLPAIVMTGGALWNVRDGSYSAVQYFPVQTAKQLFDFYASRDIPTFAYALADGLIQIYHLGDFNDTERLFIAQRDKTPYKKFHLDVPSMPENLIDKVMLFYAMQPDARFGDAFSHLRQMDINPMYYHDIFGEEIAIMEAFPATTSKAQALRHLTADTGADRVVVFGDNVNDLSMFEVADVKVAVSNAVDEVKEKADIVIGPNTDDSVARFILEDFSRNT